MNRAALLVFVLTAALTSTGCSIVAPKYTASLTNVQQIKDSGIQAVKVGKFDSTPGKGNANPISLRGSSLDSPYEKSYAKYLAESISQELSLAGKLAPDAQIEISGALSKNDISIPISSGSGDIEARFVVTRGGTVRYDQVKAIHDEWDSSFVGAIAIPRATQRYPTMVEKLLAALYSDPAFIQALK